MADEVKIEGLADLLQETVDLVGRESVLGVSDGPRNRDEEDERPALRQLVNRRVHLGALAVGNRQPRAGPKLPGKLLRDERRYPTVRADAVEVHKKHHLIHLPHFTCVDVDWEADLRKLPRNLSNTVSVGSPSNLTHKCRAGGGQRKGSNPDSLSVPTVDTRILPLGRPASLQISSTVRSFSPKKESSKKPSSSIACLRERTSMESPSRRPVRRRHRLVMAHVALRSVRGMRLTRSRDASGGSSI